MKNSLLFILFALFASYNLQSQTLIAYLDSSKIPLRISNVNIEIKVLGNIATTTIDMSFINDSNKTLEGELNFPLAEGQTVSRFAMDVNDFMREAVVVEKDKGRIAYESIVRSGVDPGLLEMTDGNNFKMRVYPILPNKSKRIIIAYEEVLRGVKYGQTYRLPLKYPNKLSEFTIKAIVYSKFSKPTLKGDYKKLKFEHDADAYVCISKYSNYIANNQFEFVVPQTNNHVNIYTENYKNEDYFNLSFVPEFIETQKKLPKSIAIYYDISHSRGESNREKEIELIEKYINKIGNCSVYLISFSFKQNKELRYEINSGNINNLINKIKSYRYDGGTSIGSLSIPQNKYDEVLIFSDGISNFSKKEIKDLNSRIYCINSSQSANHGSMTAISDASQGKYINLLNTTIDEALKNLINEVVYIKSIEIDNKDAAKDIVYNKVIENGKSVNICGKMTANKCKIKANYGNIKTTISKEFEINSDKYGVESGIIPRLWAKEKLAELSRSQNPDDTLIVELGKKYSIVTQQTSLIVLESVWQYHFFKIDPPEDLREEYNEQYGVKAEEFDVEEDSIEETNDSGEVEFECEVFDGNENYTANKILKNWWNYNFVKDVRELDSAVEYLKKKGIPNPENYFKINYYDCYSLYKEDTPKYLIVICDELIHELHCDYNDNKNLSKKADDYNKILTNPFIYRYNSGINNVFIFNDSIDINIPVKNINKTFFIVDLDTIEAYKNLETNKINFVGYIENDSIKIKKGSIAFSPFFDKYYDVIDNKYDIEDFRERNTKVAKLLIDDNKITCDLLLDSVSKDNENYYKFLNYGNPVVGKIKKKKSEYPLIFDFYDRYGNVLNVENSLVIHPSGQLNLISMRDDKFKYIKKNFTPDNYIVSVRLNKLGPCSFEANLHPDSATNISCIIENGSYDNIDPISFMRLNQAEDHKSKILPKINFLVPDIDTNANYLKEIEKAGKNDFENEYYKQKEKYSNMPSFYLDVSEYAMKNIDRETALRILSTIADLKLEEGQYQRVMAFKLEQFKEYEFAESAFDRVFELRKNEMQSYRDLALLKEKMGKYQDAANLMYKLIDSNYNYCISTYITEFNHIIKSSKNTVDLKNYDSCFVHDCQVDLRIIINWDMDNTNIDLHVVEPKDIECSKYNDFTMNGGMLSSELIVPMGPEEYMIKDAAKGKYKIKVNYYSDLVQKAFAEKPNLKLLIYTNYGRENEKCQEIMLKLNSKNEIQEIAEIEIK